MATFNRALGKVFAVTITALALSSCNGSATDEDGDVGRIVLALQQAPADVDCLKLTIDSASSQPLIVKLFPVTAGAPTQFTLSNLPLGNVGLTTEAYDTACLSVTSTTPITWVSDRTVVNLIPDFSPTVTLSLRRSGRINLGVDFVAGLMVEEVKLPSPPTHVAAAPDGSVVISALVPDSIWRASSPFNAAFVASTVGRPTYLAVAADGTIFVATVDGSVNRLVSFTPAGMPKNTVNLAFEPGDVLIDNANTVWVASLFTPQLARVATATTTPVMTVRSLAGVQAAPGLALASNGSLRVAAQPGVIATVSSAGSPVSNLPVLGLPRDLAIAGDSSIWYVSQPPNGSVVRVVGNSAVNLFSMPVLGRVSIANSPAGIVVARTSGGLLLGRSDGSVQVLPLPDNAVVGSLAVAANGKLWAVDSERSRLLIVTLP